MGREMEPESGICVQNPAGKSYGIEVAPPSSAAGAGGVTPPVLSPGGTPAQPAGGTPTPRVAEDQPFPRGLPPATRALPGRFAEMPRDIGEVRAHVHAPRDDALKLHFDPPEIRHAGQEPSGNFREPPPDVAGKRPDRPETNPDGPETRFDAQEPRCDI
jgi:hypothetical protein